MTIEDLLVEESMSIVRRARKINKCLIVSPKANKSIGIEISKKDEIIYNYLYEHKNCGTFYLIGTNEIDNPRKLIRSSFKDFIYCAIFDRLLSSIGANFKIKLKIYRMLGAKIGKNVKIFQGVKLDLLIPKLIEIEDNTIIGGFTKIYAHSIAQDYIGWGIIKIGKNCNIGNDCLCAGLYMEDNSKLMPRTNTTYPQFIPPNKINSGKIYCGNPPIEYKEYLRLLKNQNTK